MFKTALHIICVLFTVNSFAKNLPLIIGIVGGSGSGKTTLANNIAKALKGNVTIISQDSYYKDLSHIALADRKLINFDAPSSIDFDSLFRDISDLKQGKSITKPRYDFTTHTRKSTSEHVKSNDIIIVEGILLFTHEQLRDLIDIKIFVDASAEERIMRRIGRDTKERGRTYESVHKQYLETVAPMFETHVLPTKKYANLIIPNSTENQNSVALEILISKSHAHLACCHQP